MQVLDGLTIKLRLKWCRVRDDNPLDYLLPDLSDLEDVSEVKQIRLGDQGSHPQHAKVVIGGVPMESLVDSGSDITILGGEMFK